MQKQRLALIDVIRPVRWMALGRARPSDKVLGRSGSIARPRVGRATEPPA